MRTPQADNKLCWLSISMLTSEAPNGARNWVQAEVLANVLAVEA